MKPNDPRRLDIDSIISDLVERLNAGEALNPFEILARHPEQGAEILKDLDMYTSLESDNVPNDGSADAPLGILGDYTLRRQIGRGGMGVVYDAWQGSMDRRVALKVLPAGIAADDRAFQRFMQEARAAGKLSHPNIVAVHAMGQDASTPYYAMDFIDGETLAQILAKLKEAEAGAETPFGKKDDVRYFANLADAFAAVADGLQHAHSKGVIHRDIKPSNLILDREGRLRILDFGLARLEGQEGLTLTGDFLGTPQYMSPEQARRKKVAIDHRTDVYSLGATMYQALTGSPPFLGKDHADTLSQIIERDPAEPRRGNPRVPKDLETIVLKCLRKDAGDRYGTAEAMGQDLRRFVRGEVIEARAEAPWAKLARSAWRNRGRAAAILAVVLLGVMSTFHFLRVRSETQSRRLVEYHRQVLSAVRGMSLGTFLTTVESREKVKSWSHIGLVTAEDYLSLLRNDAQDSLVASLGTLQKAALDLPHRPEAHYHRARGLLLLRQHSEALRELDLATSVDTNFVPAAVLRASILEDQGKKDAADALLQSSAQAAHAGWGRAWLSAQRATKEQRWQDAALAFGKVIDAEEAGSEAYSGATLDARLGRGWARFYLKEYVGALQDSIVAEWRWPSEFAPLLLKGAALFCLGHRDEAESVFESCYFRSGARDVVAFSIAQLYLEHLREAEGARSWCERLKAEGPRLKMRTYCLWWRGRNQEVVDEARKACQVLPDDPVTYQMLSAALTDRLGAHEESERVAREAIRRFPGYVMFCWPLELALWKQKKFAEARDVLLEGLKLAPSDGVLHSELAAILLCMGETDEAFRMHEKAVALSPRDIDVVNQMAWNLVEAGRLNDALEFLDRWIREWPRNPWNRRLKATALERLGRLDEAASIAKSAILFPPNWPFNFVYPAKLLERQGEIEEAFDTCVAGVEQSIEDEELLEQLALLQHRHPDGERLSSRWDRLAKFLDRDRAGLEKDAWFLNALALCKLHGKTRRNEREALQLAESATSASKRQEPDILGTLAEAQFAAGQTAKAVLSLEEALALPSAEAWLRIRLESYRKAALPELPSYCSMDAALKSTIDDPGEDASLVGRFRSIASGEDAPRRLAYLEANLHLRAGRRSEALAALSDLASKETARPEPVLRLAACLREAGECALAADRLRSALEGAFASSREAWELWTAVSFADLGRSPDELLASAPLVGSRKEPGDYKEDLRWLLDQLRDRGAVRIHCGGDEFVDRNGQVWGRDRFFIGGRDTRGGWLSNVLDTFPGKILGTPEPAIYRTYRSFPREQSLTAGYRIPLPRGTYQVRLHFAELYWAAPNLRRFDVLIEGQEVLKDHDVLATVGFATAEGLEFESAVNDGVLEITLVPRVDCPMVSAIEIERIH